jgi:Outer membrane protein beta-barrel domain
MTVRMMLAAALLGVMCTPRVAAAQDDRNFGLVASTGSLVGVEWRVSDRLALRPAIGFSVTDTDDDDVSESSASVVTFDLAVPLTVGRWNDLLAYLAPRVGLGRSATEITTGGSGLTVQSTGTIYTFGGSFGAQYTWADRFAVFGETGLTYSHTSSELELVVFPTNDREINSFGTRSAVGVVFYF